MVERRAIGHHADRRAQSVVQVRSLDRDHRIAPRQCKPGEIAEEIRQPRELCAGLVQRTAVVQGFQPVQGLKIRLERIREPVDQPRPRADVHAAPLLAFERQARAFHGAIDVVGGRIGNARDDVAGRGIAHVEHRPGAGLDLAAVDEIAVKLDGRGL